MIFPITEKLPYHCLSTALPHSQREPSLLGLDHPRPPTLSTILSRGFKKSNCLWQRGPCCQSLGWDARTIVPVASQNKFHFHEIILSTAASHVVRGSREASHHRGGRTSQAAAAGTSCACGSWGLSSASQAGGGYAMQMSPPMARPSAFTVSPKPALETQCKWTNPQLLQIPREPWDGEALWKLNTTEKALHTQTSTHQSSKVLASPLGHLDFGTSHRQSLGFPCDPRVPNRGVVKSNQSRWFQRGK